MHKIYFFHMLGDFSCPEKKVVRHRMCVNLKPKGFGCFSSLCFAYIVHFLMHMHDGTNQQVKNCKLLVNN